MDRSNQDVAIDHGVGWSFCSREAPSQSTEIMKLKPKHTFLSSTTADYLPWRLHDWCNKRVQLVNSKLFQFHTLTKLKQTYSKTCDISTEMIGRHKNFVIGEWHREKSQPCRPLNKAGRCWPYRITEADKSLLTRHQPFERLSRKRRPTCCLLKKQMQRQRSLYRT